MKTRLFSLSVVLLLFSSGCRVTYGHMAEVTSFPVNRTLTADSVSISQVAVSPVKLFAESDRLVVFNTQKLPLMDFFSLPEMNYLYSYGDIGNARNEFSDFDYIIRVSGNYYRAFQQFKKKIVNIQLTDTGVEVLDEVAVKMDGMLSGFAFLKNGKCLSFPWQGEPAEYAVWDPQIDNIQTFGEFPEDKNVAPQTDPNRIFLRTPVSSPDGSRFVSMYAFFPRFRIYTSEGELVADVTVKEGVVDEALSSDIRKRKVYASASVATDSHIYVLSNLYDKNQEQIPVLQVWDWQGNPLAQYRLDRNWNCFTVSETEQVLYAYSYKSEDMIFVYHF